MISLADPRRRVYLATTYISLSNQRDITWRDVVKAAILAPLAALAFYAWPAGLFLGLMWLSQYCHRH